MVAAIVTMGQKKWPEKVALIERYFEIGHAQALVERYSLLGHAQVVLATGEVVSLRGGQITRTGFTELREL